MNNSGFTLLAGFLGGLSFGWVVPPLLARWVDEIGPGSEGARLPGAFGALVAVGAWFALVGLLLFVAKALTEQSSSLTALAVFAGMLVSALIPRRKKRFALGDEPRRGTPS